MLKKVSICTVLIALALSTGACAKKNPEDAAAEYVANTETNEGAAAEPADDKAPGDATSSSLPAPPNVPLDEALIVDAFSFATGWWGGARPDYIRVNEEPVEYGRFYSWGTQYDFLYEWDGDGTPVSQVVEEIAPIDDTVHQFVWNDETESWDTVDITVKKGEVLRMGTDEYSEDRPTIVLDETNPYIVFYSNPRSPRDMNFEVYEDDVRLDGANIVPVEEYRKIDIWSKLDAGDHILKLVYYDIDRGHKIYYTYVKQPVIVRK